MLETIDTEYEKYVDDPICQNKCTHSFWVPTSNMDNN